MMKSRIPKAMLLLVVSKFNNISLKKKLLICYGSLIVFSVLIGGFSSYNNFNKYVYQQAGELHKQTLEQIKINIEGKLTVYDGLANQIATDRGFVAALSARYESYGDFAYEYLNTISKMLEIKEKDNNILDAFILKNNETLLENWDNLIDINNAKDTWWYKEYFFNMNDFNISDYIRLSKSKIWVLTEEMIKPKYYPAQEEKSEKKVAVIKPIIDKYEKISGILVLYIKYESVFGELSTLNNFSSDRIFIADQTKTIVFDNYSTDSLVLDGPYLEIMSLGNQATFQTGEGKNRRFSLYSKGHDSGWTYFKEVSIDNMFAGAKEIRKFAFFNGLLSIVISIAIALFIAAALSRRIAVLAGRMEQVEDLTLDVKVKVEGRDEIGNLAGSFNRMINKIRQLVEDLKLSQQRQNDAEVTALQAQINPHFLYNTLATINWMAMGNQNTKIVAMVKSLSTFYRLSLNKGREFLKVEEELLLSKSYTHIQKIRWEDKINIVYDISENIREYYTLKLILQPFIENAIIHGAEHKNGAVTNIVIRGYQVGEKIILEVIDDGMGMKNASQCGKFSAGTGYGIRNVNDKICLKYGSVYGVNVFSRLGIGTQVSISIPVLKNNPNL